MNEFVMVDPVVKKFAADFNARLVLGHKEYDLRVLDFGEKGRIRIYEADSQGMVKIDVMPNQIPAGGGVRVIPLCDLYAVLEKIKGDL